MIFDNTLELVPRQGRHQTPSYLHSPYCVSFPDSTLLKNQSIITASLRGWYRIFNPTRCHRWTRSCPGSTGLETCTSGLREGKVAMSAGVWNVPKISDSNETQFVGMVMHLHSSNNPSQDQVYKYNHEGGQTYVYSLEATTALIFSCNLCSATFDFTTDKSSSRTPLSYHNRLHRNYSKVYCCLLRNIQVRPVLVSVEWWCSASKQLFYKYQLAI